MRRFVDAASRKKNQVDGEEVDRIPGTTKLRTWCANSSLYSNEDIIESIARSVQICSNDSQKRGPRLQKSRTG